MSRLPFVLLLVVLMAGSVGARQLGPFPDGLARTRLPGLRSALLAAAQPLAASAAEKVLAPGSGATSSMAGAGGSATGGAIVVLPPGLEARAVADPQPTLTATPTSEPAAPPVAATPVLTATVSSHLDSRTFVSATLGRTMPYLIYLPPGYDSDPQRRYPVLYMLHGMGGSNTEWPGYSLLGAADELIKNGAIRPLLIVMPQGDQGYWLDHADGGPRWGTYVARDVVAEIDGRFRTVPDRAHRAVGGLSMGAHGALQLAMNFPDVFGVVGAHSPTLRDFGDAPKYFGDAEEYKARDPRALIERRPDIAASLRIWVDVGQDDHWLPVVEQFHALLKRLGVPHQWHTAPGEHSGFYWRDQGPAYLRFYSAAFGA